ncbi:MAG: selenide, water dikinase SelD [Planctomycetes bacterium]|nr:selenide, water dikinase SelD [Planctomycetota bacterium]
MAPAAVADTLVVGPEGFDDAGIVRADDGRMQLFTVDFFPPVVDDPAAFGAIAAANSLSDIYACGGDPKVVLNIAGFPEDWGDETLTPIFDAAVAVVRESGAIWVGGHTVRADEPLFGFAVYGEAAEEHLVTQAGCQPGDRLYLTKPLGAGSITTGVKRGKVSPDQEAAAVQGMARLNKRGLTAMRAAGVKAATDITGFGLFGHAMNMARSSGVTLDLRAVGLPLYDGAADLAAEGVFSGAANRGRESLGDLVEISADVPEWLASLCFDAETSGGLLVAVPEEGVSAFEAELAEEAPAFVGEVLDGEAKVRLR